MGNNKENKKMDPKEKALDYAIHETTYPKYTGGYKIKDTTEEGKEKKYDNYMRNDEWENFKKNMSPIHQTQYNKGDGGELEEKRGRYGLYPPKMASFGSSSRFIYKLSKDIPGFVFEEKLSTCVGRKTSKANLDGFLQKEKENIYVEAKCREIYGSHKKIEINNKYEEVYKRIHELTKKKFSYIKEDTSKKEGYSKYTFKYNGKYIEHFDIKQLICHFLAIAADYLGKKHTRKIKFLYLIFDPHEVENKIDSKYKNKILDIYDETIEEIESINISILFKAVWEYQKKRFPNSSFDKCPDFSFVLCNQDDYKKHLETT